MVSSDEGKQSCLQHSQIQVEFSVDYHTKLDLGVDASAFDFVVLSKTDVNVILVGKLL